MPRRTTEEGVGPPPDLAADMAAVASLDIEGLRDRWKALFRKPAPAHLPRYLLLRIILYRMQANVLGDLDRETVRYLDRVAAEWKKRRASGEKRSSKSPPPIPPVPDRRSLKPGTILVREHAGELQRVVVLDKGFTWNGTSYRSLSEVACAITGTKWNGPRFFGLRQRKGASEGEEAAP
jgi:Protein of unknown function (DUF2924)